MPTIWQKACRGAVKKNVNWLPYCVVSALDGSLNAGLKGESNRAAVSPFSAPCMTWNHSKAKCKEMYKLIKISKAKDEGNNREKKKKKKKKEIRNSNKFCKTMNHFALQYTLSREWHSNMTLLVVRIAFRNNLIVRSIASCNPWN